MTPRIFLLTALASFALLLAACESAGVSDPFPNAEIVSATTDPTTAVESGQLGAGERVVFEVLLSSSVRANQAMYFEANTNAVNLALYNSGGASLASSSSEALFESGLRALSGASTVAADFDSQGLTTVATCRGTCILRDANASTFYLEVINPTSSTVSFNLYLFSEDYADEYEPQNDTQSGAPTLPGSTNTDTGAIEHIGDRDFWEVAQNGSVSFTANTSSGIDLRMSVTNSAGTVVDGPYAPGGSAIGVSAGEFVVVVENGNDAAGVAANSRYTLGFTAGSGPSDPFAGATVVNASTSPSSAVVSSSLGGNETIVYEVRLGSSVRANQAMYFEANTDTVNLALYNSTQTALASSTSSARFVSGLQALSGASTVAVDLESQAIGVAPTCRGTCILRNANASTFYLEVINPTSSNVPFSLFLFSEDYADEYELGNDTRSGAPTLQAGIDSGAIERIGDQDFWAVGQTGFVSFTADSSSGIDVRMSVTNSAGTVVDGPYAPGGSAIGVSAGEFVLVFENGNDAAGVAAKSGYTLQLQ